MDPKAEKGKTRFGKAAIMKIYHKAANTPGRTPLHQSLCGQNHIWLIHSTMCPYNCLKHLYCMLLHAPVMIKDALASAGLFFDDFDGSQNNGISQNIERTEINEWSLTIMYKIPFCGGVHGGPMCWGLRSATAWICVFHNMCSRAQYGDWHTQCNSFLSPIYPVWCPRKCALLTC